MQNETRARALKLAAQALTETPLRDLRLMTAEAYGIITGGLLDAYESELTMRRAARIVEQAQRELDEAMREVERKKRPKRGSR